MKQGRVYVLKNIKLRPSILRYKKSSAALSISLKAKKNLGQCFVFTHIPVALQFSLLEF
jgi:hypothetical protein